MALKPDANSGVNIGARLLIGFMIGFLFLRYSIFLSICLGFLAGVTGGFIASWWNAKEDYLRDEETAQESVIAGDGEAVKAIAPLRKIRRGFGVRPARRSRETRAIRRFGWLWRRDR
jgi:lipopolysaccharide export LptBFGC system permease protein LptF